MSFEETSLSDIKSAKKIMRRDAEFRRQKLARNAGEFVPQRLLENFTETWNPPSWAVISAFWPFKSELDIRLLIHHLSGNGYSIALPEVTKKCDPLLFRKWTKDIKLVKDNYGVLCLPDNAKIVLPDWLLVPLLAVDKAGFRLGYGGGFYDLTLAKLRKEKKIFAIGVAYDDQIVEKVPRDQHDSRLDAILTERQAVSYTHLTLPTNREV